MKLNSDIINYHFARKYPIQYIPGSGSESELGRPLYYHPGTKQTAHLLLLRKPDVPDLPGTFLCFSDGPVRPSPQASVFVFPEQADREDVYNALQELYDYYDEWENTCMQIVEKFQDFRSLIRCTYQYFRIPLCLLDNQFNIIASEHEPDSPYALFSDAGQINLDTVNDIISNPHFRNLETRGGESLNSTTTGIICCTISVSGGRYCGAPGHGGRGSPPASRTADSRILERLAELVRDAAPAVRVLPVHLLGPDVSCTPSSPTAWPERFPILREIQPGSGQNTGWAGRALLSDGAVPPGAPAEAGSVSPLSGLAGGGAVARAPARWSIRGQRGPAAEPDPLRRRQAVGVLSVPGVSGPGRPDGGRVQPGLYRPAGDQRILPPGSLRAGIRQKKDSTRWYFRFNDYGLEYLLSYGTGIFKPEQVCHPALLTLREHDQQRQTSYYATLLMYFEQQFNMSKAAEKLYIHRSTFINRMERILELTHLNLADYDTRLYLELSFRLLREPDVSFQFYV